MPLYVLLNIYPETGYLRIFQIELNPLRDRKNKMLPMFPAPETCEVLRVSLNAATRVLLESGIGLFLGV